MFFNYEPATIMRLHPLVTNIWPYAHVWETPAVTSGHKAHCILGWKLSTLEDGGRFIRICAENVTRVSLENAFPTYPQRMWLEYEYMHSVPWIETYTHYHAAVPFQKDDAFDDARFTARLEALRNRMLTNDFERNLPDPRIAIYSGLDAPTYHA